MYTLIKNPLHVKNRVIYQNVLDDNFLYNLFFKWNNSFYTGCGRKTWRFSKWYNTM